MRGLENHLWIGSLKFNEKPFTNKDQFLKEISDSNSKESFALLVTSK